MKAASAPQYARAKAAALKVIAEMMEPDAIILDRIEFRNEIAGFVIRLGYGDAQIQKIVGWGEISRATVGPDALCKAILPPMFHALARHDFNKG